MEAGDVVMLKHATAMIKQCDANLQVAMDHLVDRRFRLTQAHEYKADCEEYKASLSASGLRKYEADVEAFVHDLKAARAKLQEAEKKEAVLKMLLAEACRREGMQVA